MKFAFDQLSNFRDLYVYIVRMKDPWVKILILFLVKNLAIQILEQPVYLVCSSC